MAAWWSTFCRRLSCAALYGVSASWNTPAPSSSAISQTTSGKHQLKYLYQLVCVHAFVCWCMWIWVRGIAHHLLVTVAYFQALNQKYQLQISICVVHAHRLFFFFCLSFFLSLPSVRSWAFRRPAPAAICPAGGAATPPRLLTISRCVSICMCMRYCEWVRACCLRVCVVCVCVWWAIPRPILTISRCLILCLCMRACLRVCVRACACVCLCVLMCMAQVENLSWRCCLWV